MNQAKGLVVEGANGSNNQASLAAIGNQLSGLISQAVDIGNTQVGNRYIFGGQQDSSPPMALQQSTGNTNGAVVYNGDNNKISMPVGPGSVNPSVDGINLTGSEVFGPVQTSGGQATLTVFNQLIAIQNQLLNGTPAQSNALGGSSTVSGTYTGAGTQEFEVKVTGVGASGTATAGQVTSAEYSTDGGTTWTNAAASTTAGNPSSVSLPGGVSLNIATNTGTAVGDTYTFAVENGTSGAVTDTNWLTNVGLGYISSAQTMQSNAEAELGTRESSYQMMQNLLSNANTTITTNLSNNDDTNMAVAETNYENSKNVYQAALDIGAQIIPLSLVNYLGSSSG
jgi:flagellin-like hook-associated protein FlgL